MKGSAIISSGWWVALAAVAVTLAVGAVLVASLFNRAPGSPKGARESLEAAAGLVGHALEMMRGKGHACREAGH